MEDQKKRIGISDDVIIEIVHGIKEIAIKLIENMFQAKKTT